MISCISIKKFIVDKHEHYIYVYMDPRKHFINEKQYGILNYKFSYEPFYIGKGKENRLYKHLNESELKEDSTNKLKIYKIKKILKLGLKPIIIKLKYNLSENEALELEKLYIENIGRKQLKNGPLLNATNGGDQPPILYGKDNPMYGKEVSEKTRKKLSEIMKGRFIGENNPMFGKKLLGKNNPMWGRKGDKSPHYGKKRSDEIKKKIGESNSFVWFLLDPNNDIIGPIFNLNKFCKEKNLDPSGISKIYLNKLNHYKKWKVHKRYKKIEYDRLFHIKEN